MSVHVQNAIEIIDDILSKVDEFSRQAVPPAAAAANAGTEKAAATGKAGKKKDKKTKKEANAAPTAATTNQESSDPFAMADLRVLRYICVNHLVLRQFLVLQAHNTKSKPENSQQKLTLCKYMAH